MTEENGIYFLTSTIVEWMPVFTSREYFEIVIDAFKFCRSHKNLKLYAYVILDNHFHLVVSGSNLSAIIQSLKRHTSKQIIQLLQTQNKKWLLSQLAFYKKKYKSESTHQVWQEGFHPELMQSEQMLLQKIKYIHHNPVKRGYVERPEYWLYSSARNFILEDHSLIELDALPNIGSTASQANITRSQV
jgi:putative transposase